MTRLIAATTMMLLSSLSAMPASAQGVGERDFWHPAWGYGHMMFGGLMMIVFWGAVVLLIVLLVRWISSDSGGGRTQSPPRQSPLDILQERFARGEIDQKEYEERRKVLPD